MLDLSKIEVPVFGDKESGLRFVKEALNLWSAELETYQGKSDTATTKVSAVLETVQKEDPSAVKSADIIAENLRLSILIALQENPNVAVVLFPILDDIKKAVGSYRSETTVTVETPDDDDRDLVSEYEALDKARTMIEGTFNAWQLSPGDLPAKYVGVKNERVSQPDGTSKNVPTGETYLKFPGKLTNPNGEGNTSPGKAPVSFSFLWEIKDNEGQVFSIGKSTVTRLARLCSSEHDLLSFSDLKERLDNHKWMDKETSSLTIRVPRGTLVGVRTNK